MRYYERKRRDLFSPQLGICWVRSCWILLLPFDAIFPLHLPEGLVDVLLSDG